MNPPRRILVPLDLGDDAVEAREAGAALAAALDADLVLVGVAPIAVDPVAPGLAGMPVPPVGMSETQGTIEVQVRDRLDDALDRLPPTVHARSAVRFGETGPAVVDAVEAEHADLVVITMRRESGLEHALGDHVQRHILHNAGVPVLVVPVG